MNDKNKKSTFMKLKENNKMLIEIFTLLRKNKKWWLLPIFLVFAVLSFFIVLVGGGSILPAIYSVF